MRAINEKNNRHAARFTGAYVNQNAFRPWINVAVYDASTSLWVYLSDYYYRDADARGWDWVVSATWGQNTDSMAGQATIVLRRQSATGKLLSLSPLNERSPYNLGGGSYEPLLYPGTLIDIMFQYAPVGAPPVGNADTSDWMSAFRGWIDTIDFGGDTITIEMRDTASKFQDRFIEDVLVYGFTGTSGRGAKPWSAGMAIDDASSPDTQTRVIPSWADNDTWDASVSSNPYYFKCTAEGTSGGVTGTAEPDWADATETDNGATWTRQSTFARTDGCAISNLMTGIVKDNMDGDSTYFTVDGSPTWTVPAGRQERMSIADALSNLAGQMGWALHVFYSGGYWKLHLWEPDRDKSVADYTFGPGTVLDYRRLAISRAGIRNVVRVVYSDFSTTMTNGKQAPRASVTVSDATSISTYGRRFCEISEAFAANIDGSTEATTLANAVLNDLKDPPIEAEVVVPFFAYTELGDLYTFSADGERFTSDQKLAVFGYQHQVTATGAITTFQVRGLPTAGFTTWHRRMTDAGVGKPLHNTPPPRPITATDPQDVLLGYVSNGSNHITCSIDIGDFSYRWDHIDVYTELHAHGWTEMAPSSSNYYGPVYSGTFSLGCTINGSDDLYMILVAVDKDGQESVPSPMVELYHQIL